MESGEKFLPVISADLKACGLGPVSPPSSEGDRFIVVQGADGKPLAVKCERLDEEGQRGIPVIYADGVVGLVRFDGGEIFVEYCSCPDPGVPHYCNDALWCATVVYLGDGYYSLADCQNEENSFGDISLASRAEYPLNTCLSWEDLGKINDPGSYFKFTSKNSLPPCGEPGSYCDFTRNDGMPWDGPGGASPDSYCALTDDTFECIGDGYAQVHQAQEYSSYEACMTECDRCDDSTTIVLKVPSDEQIPTVVKIAGICYFSPKVVTKQATHEWEAVEGTFLDCEECEDIIVEYCPCPDPGGEAVPHYCNWPVKCAKYSYGGYRYFEPGCSEEDLFGLAGFYSRRADYPLDTCLSGPEIGNPDDPFYYKLTMKADVPLGEYCDGLRDDGAPWEDNYEPENYCAITDDTGEFVGDAALVFFVDLPPHDSYDECLSSCGRCSEADSIALKVPSDEQIPTVVKIAGICYFLPKVVTREATHEWEAVEGTFSNCEECLQPTCEWCETVSPPSVTFIPLDYTDVISACEDPDCIANGQYYTYVVGDTTYYTCYDYAAFGIDPESDIISDCYFEAQHLVLSGGEQVIWGVWLNDPLTPCTWVTGDTAPNPVITGPIICEGA